MPSAEHVDLEDAERVEIVLVPLDDGAVLHRRVLDRHQLVEPAARDDEAADMLRQVAREADRARATSSQHLSHARVGRVEPAARRRSAVATAAADQPQIDAGERADRRPRDRPNDLADLADRPSGRGSR